ncbi:hypothetical protein ACQP2C_16175 [Micromonospora zamorensis]|uniref:hypothetical protein n=1 Tax=Micromonospora zamorensis TaxID=709883 RepID=UPI003D97A8E4
MEGKVLGVAPVGVLLLALGLLGVTTISGQVLTPLAGDLAGAADRGRVVGTVGSGTLTGILASRTISGFVAEAAGWRSIFVLAALVSAPTAGRAACDGAATDRRDAPATA